ncbi:unnamed protein product [Camellia sinensis]
MVEVDEDDSEDHSLIELAGDVLLEESFDDIKQAERPDCPFFFNATFACVLRIELEEVGLTLLETIFLLVEFTGDIPTLADDALPELSVKEEDFGGGFVLLNVEELEEEAFEDNAGLCTVLQEPPKPCIFVDGATLPGTVTIIQKRC